MKITKKIATTSALAPVFFVPKIFEQRMRQLASACLHFVFSILLSVCCLLPVGGFSQELDSSIGGYAGQYYDSEPAGFSQGRANYVNQYIVAITASKNIWRAESWPLSLELDGMVGQQFGLATLSEVAIAPVLRWSSFPWKEVLQTDLRVGPVGVSYTSRVSPLERGQNENGSHILNFLMIELAFSLPQHKTDEVFLRLHHRCTIYDLLNNYGANGEDFFALGYRAYF